jgi:hypothetical protein
VALHWEVQHTGPLQHWFGCGEELGLAEGAYPPREGLRDGVRLGEGAACVRLALRDGEAARELLGDAPGVRLPEGDGLAGGGTAPQSQRLSYSCTIRPSRHRVPGATSIGSYACPLAQKKKAREQVPGGAGCTEPQSVPSQGLSSRPGRSAHTTDR